MPPTSAAVSDLLPCPARRHTLRALAALSALPALPAPAAVAAAGTAYDAAGPERVEVLDLRWTDASRNRALPLRLRLPQGASAAHAATARPLILFSHGLGGSVDAGTAWATHWASHGFAVLHLQHPGSDAAVWQDPLRDGAGLLDRARAARELRAAANVEQFEARVHDVKFVLDELARRQRAGDATARQLDLARIGMSGHSYGAVTTQALAGQRYSARGTLQARADALAEPRIAAFIAFSPSARGDDPAQQFAAITRPFFSVTGTEDGEVGMGLGVKPAQRLLPFALMPAPDKYLLNLDGADHAIFSGQPRWRDAERADADRDALHRRLVQATTLAFWQATLRADAAARQWLRRDAAALIGTAGSWQAK